MTFRHLGLTLALALSLTPALAQSPNRSDIRVAGAWARPTPPTAKTAAAYMTVTAMGGEDRLVGASTPVAGRAEVHETTNDNGVMKMRPAGAITVTPGMPTMLKPGGLHVMMTDLKQPLADGQTFPLTLKFEKAGTIEAMVHVMRTAPGGAMTPPAAAMPMDMDHSKMGH